MLSLSSNWVSGEFEFAHLIFFSNSGSSTWSRLKSSTHPVSWKMIPHSGPKLSDFYTLSQTKLLENHTLYSSIAHIWQYPPPPPHTYKLLLISSYSLMQMVLTYVISIQLRLTVQHCTINGELYLQNLKRKKKFSLHVMVFSNKIVLPIRSTMTEFPSMSEKPNSTQGKNGALKVKRPKKFMRT